MVNKSDYLKMKLKYINAKNKGGMYGEVPRAMGILADPENQSMSGQQSQQPPEWSQSRPRHDTRSPPRGRQHSFKLSPQQHQIRERCRNFAREGFCKYGEHCRFSHSEDRCVSPQRRNRNSRNTTPHRARRGRAVEPGKIKGTYDPHSKPPNWRQTNIQGVKSRNLKLILKKTKGIHKEYEDNFQQLFNRDAYNPLQSIIVAGVNRKVNKFQPTEKDIDDLIIFLESFSSDWNATWYQWYDTIRKYGDGPLNLFVPPHFDEIIFYDQQKRAQLLVSKFLQHNLDNIYLMDGHGRMAYSICDEFTRQQHGWIPDMNVIELANNTNHVWHQLFFPPNTSINADMLNYVRQGNRRILYYINYCGIGGREGLQSLIYTLRSIEELYSRDSTYYNIVISYCPRGIDDLPELEELERMFPYYFTRGSGMNMFYTRWTNDNTEFHDSHVQSSDQTASRSARNNETQGARGEAVPHGEVVPHGVRSRARADARDWSLPPPSHRGAVGQAMNLYDKIKEYAEMINDTSFRKILVRPDPRHAGREIQGIGIRDFMQSMETLFGTIEWNEIYDMMTTSYSGIEFGEYYDMIRESLFH